MFGPRVNMHQDLHSGRGKSKDEDWNSDSKSLFVCFHLCTSDNRREIYSQEFIFYSPKIQTHFSHVKLYASKVCIVFKNIPIEVVELPLFCFTLGLPGSESKHG